MPNHTKFVVTSIACICLASNCNPNKCWVCYWCEIFWICYREKMVVNLWNRSCMTCKLKKAFVSRDVCNISVVLNSNILLYEIIKCCVIEITQKALFI